MAIDFMQNLITLALCETAWKAEELEIRELAPEIDPAEFVMNAIKNRDGEGLPCVVIVKNEKDEHGFFPLVAVMGNSARSQSTALLFANASNLVKELTEEVETLREQLEAIEKLHTVNVSESPDKSAFQEYLTIRGQ